MAREQFSGYDDVWRYERFIATIEEQARIDTDQAERVARAVFQTLAERLSPVELRELASELPAQLQGWLLDAGEGAGKHFGPQDFIARVAEHAEEDEASARAHTQAVFLALGRIVRHREMQALARQLPASYRRLIGASLHEPPERRAPTALGIKEFLRRVEDRIGTTDPEMVVRATEAVLETLAERIADGEVEDLLEVLPEELHAPLERGLERSRHAVRMSLDEFVDRIAELEGVSFDQALEHARAVFSTLREILPEKEFSDLLAELPRGYYEALL